MDMDIGDPGFLDPAELAFDVPMPNEADEAAFESVQASVWTAQSMSTMPDMGGETLPAHLTVQDLAPDAFSPQMAEEAPQASLGALPDIAFPVTDSPGTSYAIDDATFEPPSIDAVAFPAPRSDAPAVSEAFGSSLGMIDRVNDAPMPPQVFAGVGLPPEEAFEIQMALAPPPPSQDGYGAVSDAPATSPVAAWASEADRGGAISLQALEALSAAAFGPSSSFGGSDPSAAPSGARVHVENLHLPAAKASDALSELLSLSAGGTHFDLSGLT